MTDQELFDGWQKLASYPDVSITLVYREGRDGAASWSAAATWGTEADDSPMVGAAAYAAEDTARATMVALLVDAGIAKTPADEDGDDDAV